MMKRLSLKSLRLSSHPKETAQSPDEEDEYEQPRPLPTDQEEAKLTSAEVSVVRVVATDDHGTPSTPKKKEKKGFFKSLRRKLTTNFRGKRDSVTGIVIDDDSSSENRDDGSLHCNRGFQSPRKPRSSRDSRIREQTTGDADVSGVSSRHRSRLPDRPQCPTPGSDRSRLKPSQSQPTKEELSKSEESSTPTEEERANTMFLTDAEYGHASAPLNLNLTPAQDAAVEETAIITEACVSVEGPSVVVTEAEAPITEPDQPWPWTPAPLPPDIESQATLSSDSDTQGASAPRSSEPFQGDQRGTTPPPHLPPPPPPPVNPSTSAGRGILQLDGYEPYDPRESSFRNHLALISCTGDPHLLLPVYDQLKEPPKSWSLTKELFKLSKFGWYWGPITRVEAEEKLAKQSDGAFLVRDSSDERYLLSLSFRSYGRTLHTRIEHCNGVFSFYAQPESEGYFSIVDLIEHSMNDSQTGVFCYSRARTPGSPSFPVRLTKPVSRFTQVRSLQYLCRFVIRQYTRFDHIQKLPLPPRIKGWLEQNQY